MKKSMLTAALLLPLTAFASTLVHNVTGYTMDKGKVVRFAALEFDAGRVTRLYDSEQAAAASRADQRIDGAGATLLPGLIDAHGHISRHGRALNAVDLVGVSSEAAAAQAVADFIQAHPGAAYIYGRGWNQVLWPGKAFPDRDSLDAVSGDTPVVLERVDGHALWANSAALALVGIGDDTPDPEGGQIIRDARGRATGVLVDNARDALFAALPAPTDDQMAALQLTGLKDLARVGLTSVHDAGITAQEVRAFLQLRRDDRLPVRVYGMLHVLDPDNDAYLAEGPLLDEEHLLEIRSVKISADGALGSRGAALFADYSDQPGYRGLLLLTDQELEHHMDRAMQAGYQVNTHAIGDLANDRVLDLYEQLIERHDSRALRHRVEHAQVLRPTDIPRFAASGIVASIQPTHATSDKNMAGDRLGASRLAGAYAWHSLLASGAPMAGGSDFPVEPPNPFYGLHAAVTRQDREGRPPGGWLPEEKLSRAQALSLFTEDAAWAAHQEQHIGKLLPGYYADFILVRDDYFEVPEADIWKNRVQATYLAGRQVFPTAD